MTRPLLPSKEDAQLAYAVRVCAIPRRLNADVVGVLMSTPDDEAENRLLLDKLGTMSFIIVREDGDLAFHDNVRDRLLESCWTKQTDLSSRS